MISTDDRPSKVSPGYISEIRRSKLDRLRLVTLATAAFYEIKKCKCAFEKINNLYLIVKHEIYVPIATFRT